MSRTASDVVASCRDESLAAGSWWPPGNIKPSAFGSFWNWRKESSAEKQWFILHFSDMLYLWNILSIWTLGTTYLNNILHVHLHEKEQMCSIWCHYKLFCQHLPWRRSSASKALLSNTCIGHKCTEPFFLCIWGFWPSFTIALCRESSNSLLWLILCLFCVQASLFYSLNFLQFSYS